MNVLGNLRKRFSSGMGSPTMPPIGAPIKEASDKRGPPPPPLVVQSRIRQRGKKNTPVKEQKVLRREVFDDAIKGKIDLKKLGDIAEAGIPDDLRSTYWRVLLGYLPPDESLWEEELIKKRKQYKDFCDEFIVLPESVKDKLEREKGSPQRASAEDDENEGFETFDGDHPLAADTNSLWSKYLANRTVLQIIDVDIPRTMPSLHFFNSDSGDYENLMRAIETSNGATFTRNQQHLRRLLFLFAKLNPGLGYVQGMNELAGHLFYTFAKHPHTFDKHIEDAEADSFFCFTILVSYLGDNFCRTLDRDELGIQGSLNLYKEKFQSADPVLYEHMEALNLKPEFYCFRWVTLLMSQEFIVPDVLRIWDFLFASATNINDRLFSTCVAMVMTIRDTLLTGDFSTNMQALQDFPPTNVDGFLEHAMNLLAS
eukprot:TRINITY_DN4255_c0_g1_i1.p1 TRINITY_DN4255_c0_g1~~TRINITY_DN4255_c0_g1_i1.p1  ORF type:complete len:454 (+),score=88.41 TRINITY_DN4255_c0_g1_i1:86-1363(+)